MLVLLIMIAAWREYRRSKRPTLNVKVRKDLLATDEHRFAKIAEVKAVAFYLS
jgi:hypothetical protein